MGRLTLELIKHTCPGSVGVFRLVSRAMAKSAGCQSLLEYARALADREPIRLAGTPVPRVQEGAVCLNDPSEAQEYLAVFRVGKKLNLS